MKQQLKGTFFFVNFYTIYFVFCSDPDFTITSIEKSAQEHFGEEEMTNITNSFLRRLDSFTIDEIDEIEVPDLLDSKFRLQPHQKQGIYFYCYAQNCT